MASVRYGTHDLITTVGSVYGVINTETIITSNSVVVWDDQE